jgi:hypothetical protein
MEAQVDTTKPPSNHLAAPPSRSPLLRPRSSYTDSHLSPSSFPHPPPEYGSIYPDHLSTFSPPDSRFTSTQSLAPSESRLEDAARNGKRKLLLIYIHGYMGSETSFQKFPAHVHNILSITLADTHVVHTKIYPRYKSRNAIEVARDDFSKWYVL